MGIAVWASVCAHPSLLSASNCSLHSCSNIEDENIMIFIQGRLTLWVPSDMQLLSAQLQYTRTPNDVGTL